MLFATVQRNLQHKHYDHIKKSDCRFFKKPLDRALRARLRPNLFFKKPLDRALRARLRPNLFFKKPLDRALRARLRPNLFFKKPIDRALRARLRPNLVKNCLARFSQIIYPWVVWSLFMSRDPIVQCFERCRTIEVSDHRGVGPSRCRTIERTP